MKKKPPFLRQKGTGKIWPYTDALAHYRTDMEPCWSKEEGQQPQQQVIASGGGLVLVSPVATPIPQPSAVVTLDTPGPTPFPFLQDDMPKKVDVLKKADPASQEGVIPPSRSGFEYLETIKGDMSELRAYARREFQTKFPPSTTKELIYNEILALEAERGVVPAGPADAAPAPLAVQPSLANESSMSAVHSTPDKTE